MWCRSDAVGRPRLPELTFNNMEMNEDVAVTTPWCSGCIHSVSAFSAPGVVWPVSCYGCTLWAKPTVAQWLLSSMALTLPVSSCFVQKGWNSSRFKLRPTRLIGHKLLFVLRTNSRLFSSCVIRHLKGLNALWISSAWNISVHQLTKMCVCVCVCFLWRWKMWLNWWQTGGGLRFLKQLNHSAVFSSLL